MQIENRRTLRLVTMGLALVTSVGAGFLWAQHTNTINTVAAALLTAFCLLRASGPRSVRSEGPSP